jgi:2C-methyl-D-erythritol 2,4-cyclodiphosphate synthase
VQQIATTKIEIAPDLEPNKPSAAVMTQKQSAAKNALRRHLEQLPSRNWKGWNFDIQFISQKEKILALIEAHFVKSFATYDLQLISRTARDENVASHIAERRFAAPF